MSFPDFDSRSPVQMTAQVTDSPDLTSPGHACSEFTPPRPIPYRVHSSAWPVRYALTDHGEDALRAMAGEL